jgi:hypothetical protein
MDGCNLALESVQVAGAVVAGTHMVEETRNNSSVGREDASLVRMEQIQWVAAAMSGVVPKAKVHDGDAKLERCAQENPLRQNSPKDDAVARDCLKQLAHWTTNFRLRHCRRRPDNPRRKIATLIFPCSKHTNSVILRTGREVKGSGGVVETGDIVVSMMLGNEYDDEIVVVYPHGN